MMGAALLVSSCTTGAGAGAYAGSSFGSVLGSAIGGIVGGPHGSDVGTIFGMAGGAIVGGALGDAAEKKQAQEQHEVLSRRNQRIQREKAQHRSAQQYDDDTYASANYSNGGNSTNYVGDDFDPSQMVDNSNSGDDRIDFGAPSSSGANATMGNVPMSNAPSSQSVDASRVEQIYGNAKSDGKLTIRNVRFADSNGDGMLSGDEIGQVSFEIYNETAAPIYNFDPSVVEAEANKRIYISPSVRVENIMPGQGLRYTATVKADRRIKDGEIRLLVSAQKEGKPISYVTVVKVATQRQ